MPRTTEMLALVKAEIDNDPANRGYANKSVGEKLELYNNSYVSGTTRKLVDLWKIQEAAMAGGYWIPLRLAALGQGLGTNPQVMAVAMTAMDIIQGTRFNAIDLDLASTQALLDAMVATTLITQGQRDTLEALADAPVYSSRADIVSGGPIELGEMEVALTL